MGRRPRPGSDSPPEILFIERAAVTEPIAVEVDRPLAFRPRLVGFWRGDEFYSIARVVATRREYDATYHRVLTDRGAFDLRSILRADAVTLRSRRCWEVCAELDAIPLARRP
ncbi:MAG: hypothetical protein RDU83_12400 [bacterium]|nr:hypothetical protein [bacterium]